MLANVKTALAARGLRQVELAQAVGLPQSTLSEFIRGRRELAPHFLARIAETLQADPAWLFSRVTPIPGPRPKDPLNVAALTAA
jgi:transcriptional regulator with XRE-family HTH domain